MPKKKKQEKGKVKLFEVHEREYILQIVGRDSRKKKQEKKKKLEKYCQIEQFLTLNIYLFFFFKHARLNQF